LGISWGAVLRALGGGEVGAAEDLDKDGLAGHGAALVATWVYEHAHVAVNVGVMDGAFAVLGRGVVGFLDAVVAVRLEGRVGLRDAFGRGDACWAVLVRAGEKFDGGALNIAGEARVASLADLA